LCVIGFERRSECAIRTDVNMSIIVRINPRESDVPPGHVALPVGALEALRDIDRWFKPLDETLVDDKDVESTRGEV
jgi:hypothetical protein